LPVPNFKQLTRDVASFRLLKVDQVIIWIQAGSTQTCFIPETHTG